MARARVYHISRVENEHSFIFCSGVSRAYSEPPRLPRERDRGAGYRSKSPSLSMLGGGVPLLDKLPSPRQMRRVSCSLRYPLRAREGVRARGVLGGVNGARKYTVFIEI